MCWNVLYVKFRHIIVHGVGGTWMSGSIIEDVAFILGEVTDVGYDVQC